MNVALLSLWAMVAGAAQPAPVEFPGRALYPAVPVIEMNDLARNFSRYVIVDVRSPYEYEILHIKDAFNIPLADKDFVERMRRLRASSPKPIVVYCNGKTCMKSYKAATKCRRYEIDNVLAYDRGIMDWARHHPRLAVLLGQTPVDPGRLISKSRFQTHLLDPGRFEADVATGRPIVVDIRERFQREALGLFIGREKRVNIGDHSALEKIIAQARRERRPLYIYDAAGKQVRWLQYFLEDRGARDYWFMKGGARAYFNMLRAKYVR